MTPDDSIPEVENPASGGNDPWHLTSRELAARIAALAQHHSALGDDATRAEAATLAAEWNEALSLPTATFQDQEQRVAQLDSLQRRTIEILIRTGQSA